MNQEVCPVCKSPFKPYSSKLKPGMVRTCSVKCRTTYRKIHCGTFEERFWRMVNKTDSCWEWTGSYTTFGYGQFNTEGKMNRTHKYSYELVHGKVPRGLNVCHKCDNPRCVNPDHLFLGTHKDNMADCFSKGRSVHGEKNGKMTIQDVAEIRAKYKKGDTSYLKLAKKYNIHFTHVAKIVTMNIWCHPEDLAHIEAIYHQNDNT